MLRRPRRNRLLNGFFEITLALINDELDFDFSVDNGLKRLHCSIASRRWQVVFLNFFSETRRPINHPKCLYLVVLVSPHGNNFVSVGGWAERGCHFGIRDKTAALVGLCVSARNLSNRVAVSLEVFVLGRTR